MKKEEFKNFTEQIELAKRMIKLNINIDIIADCTELEPEKIIKLKHKIGNI